MENNKQKHIVKNWRGTRKLYNRLNNEGLLDYWTHYHVKELDNTWTEYYGSNRISSPSGQMLPVLDIVETLPSVLNPGDRYLVGKDDEYYIVIIDVDDNSDNGLSSRNEQLINNSGMSVRVINKESMAYQLVNGVLKTYDKIDGGTF